MTKDEVAQIRAQVRQNMEVLEQCKLHDFQREKPGVFGSDYICTNCGGRVNSRAALWYERGLAHGEQLAREQQSGNPA